MNARDELIKAVASSGAEIKCAKLSTGEDWASPYEYDTENITRVMVLHSSYDGEEKDIFMRELNFKYDNGYGGQNLFGLVWLADGTWLARGEYDGAEWWEHKVCPKIPDELLNVLQKQEK